MNSPATRPETLTYQLSFWARRFASNHHYRSFRLGKGQLVLVDAMHHPRKIDILSMTQNVDLQTGRFWDTLIIQPEEGKLVRFGGVPKARSKSLQAQLNRHIQDYLQRFYQQFEPALGQAAQEARLLFSGHHYVRQATAKQWLDTYQWLAIGLKYPSCQRHLKAEAWRDYQRLKPFLEQGQHHIERLNQAFVKQAVRNYQTFFDQIETNPLTENQRKACVIDEQHNLVLAGAGTGKTSTMIGRAGYLLRAGLAKPEQILMLAYARKAAEEMDGRIQDKLAIQDLTVKTFHSLGKQIITEVEGMVPLIDKMAEDTTLRTRFVDEQIQRLLQNEQYKSRLLTFFIRFAYPYQSPYDFKSLGEYHAYILENDIRTLQGELVKSYEECEIANFLYRQGIAYQYEANYPHSTSGPDYKVYQPDFYLPEYGIYIEHFAVNEHNRTPPFIDQARYLEGMAWKRALHQKYQTPLIETYSYLKHQGRLTEVLSEKLQAAGVTFNPLPANALLNQLKGLGRVSEFSQLMAEILALFKAATLGMKALVEQARRDPDPERMLAAIHLFEPIYEAYQQQLRDAASIDFEDMIGQAIDYVESGRYRSPYRYLLVDEFQDISAPRSRLLKALMAQQPGSSLFGVGDDWQSIYRFSGSDVALTKDFENHFGATATSILDKTFRFNNQIGEVAARFVSENPSQIKKQIRSHRQVEHRAISLIKTSQESTGLDAALAAIQAQAKDSATVLLLARFHFKKPDLAPLKRRYPQLQLQFMSVHASKGKEADYVVVLGLEKGKHGFPSEKVTHPLLELLLPKAEAYPYAEERRLFYVALTRARHHVYLLTDGHNPSPFIRELIDKRYPILTDEFKGEGFQDQLASLPCSQCKTGYLVPRDSQYGSFFGCSQYPLCDHTQRACQRCGGSLQTEGRFRVCENPRCDFVEPICPACGGTLTLRKGPYGQFWGCAHYRKEAEFSCNHKEKFIDLQAARSR
jgi:DNA helicase-4